MLLPANASIRVRDANEVDDKDSVVNAHIVFKQL
jgi:hypothetical protein